MHPYCSSYNLDNNFASQDSSVYPPSKPYQPPPNYDDQQYPAVEQQPAPVQVT